MDMTQFNNIQDPVARAEAMRAQAIAEMIIDASNGLRSFVTAVVAKISAHRR